MTTREVTRSWFAGLVLCSGLVCLTGCTPTDSDDGNNGGNGGSDSECSGGRVLDENEECVCEEGEFNEEEDRCATDGEGGSGGESAGGNGGGEEPAGGNGGGEEPAGGNGGSNVPAGGNGGSMNTGGMMNMGGMAMASTFPCKANCKVMVVGDGLAAGTGSGANGADGAGYRALLRTALGSSYNIFVGSAGNPMNEGKKGQKAAELLPLLPAMIEKHKPDLILISIGSDDLFANPGAKLEERVIAIVDKAAELAPNAGIVVTSVPNWRRGNTTTTKNYGIALARLVRTRSDAGKHIRFVGLHGTLCGFGCGGVLFDGHEFYQNPPYPSAKGYAEFAPLISSGAKSLMGL